MLRTKVFLHFLVFSAFNCRSRVFGVIESSVYEQTCSKTPPLPDLSLNIKWAKAKRHWYYSYGSKLEFYRCSSDVTRLPVSDISLRDVRNKSCLTTKLGPSPKELTVAGYGENKTVQFFQPIAFGIMKFKLPHYQISGLTYLTLTDNESFIFLYNCYEDGLATWSVVTTTENLDVETEKFIYSHAKSLGFDSKYFTHIMYDKCTIQN